MTDEDIKGIGQRIVALMEPGILYARADLIATLGISAADWKAAAGELVARGALLRTGAKRGTRYQIPSDSPQTAERPLAPSSVEILSLIDPGREYSRSELLGQLDMSVSVWNRAIAELVDRQVITRRGERRGARYSRLTRQVDAPILAESLATKLAEVAQNVGTSPTPRAKAAASRSPAKPKPAPSKSPSTPVSKPVASRPLARPTTEATPKPAAASTRPAPKRSPAGKPASRTKQTPAQQATSAARARGRGRFELTHAELATAVSVDPGTQLLAVDGKSRLSRDFWASWSALANSGGGLIVVGARQRATGTIIVRGVKEPDEVTQQIASGFADRRVISRPGRRQSVRPQPMRGRRLLLVDVPGRPDARPVYVGPSSFSRKPFAGTFVLDESKTGFVKATAEEIEAMWCAWAAPFEISVLEEEQAVAPEESGEPSLDPTQDPVLLDLAAPARKHPRLPPSRVSDIIVDLCASRPLTSEQLASLLRRKEPTMRRYLPDLVSSGALREQNGAYVS